MASIERAIKDIGRLKKYRKNEILFSAQQKADGLYYVRSGEIRVFKMDEQGKEVEVVRLEPGDFLGEAILFVSSVFPFFAQAVKDSQVLFFEKNKIFKKIDEEPSIAKFFLNLLARKCIILNKRIETLGLQTVRQRLVQYLFLNCSGEQQCTVELKTKKAELAKILGTISETLSRNLKQLQDEGLIEVEGNKIHVKDCSKLRLELSS
jgi:CRP/FNR family transcriptional regulator